MSGLELSTSFQEIFLIFIPWYMPERYLCLKKPKHKFWYIFITPETAVLNNTPKQTIMLQAANAAGDTQALTKYNNIV